MGNEEPRLKEVTINYSAGGKISIVKYDHSSDWHTSETQKYDIPEHWSRAKAEEFAADVAEKIRTRVEARSDAEYEVRYEQSFLSGGSSGGSSSGGYGY